MIFPIQGRSTPRGLSDGSDFGMRIHPVTKTQKFHNGVDLSVPQGTPVVAVEDGVVISVINNEVCGYGLILQHGTDLRTGYCHLSAFKVKKGQSVKAGQVLGLSGGAEDSDGAGLSTGAHLHFMVYQKNQHGKWSNVDPWPFLQGSRISTDTDGPHSPRTGVEGLPELDTRGPLDTVQDLWAWMWADTPSEAAPESTAPVRTIQAPRRVPTPARVEVAPTTFTVSPSKRGQLRLVRAGRVLREGVVAPGRATVQAWAGEWLDVGEVTLEPGDEAVLTTEGERVRLIR